MLNAMSRGRFEYVGVGLAALLLTVLAEAAYPLPSGPFFALLLYVATLSLILWAYLFLRGNDPVLRRLTICKWDGLDLRAQGCCSGVVVLSESCASRKARRLAR